MSSFDWNNYIGLPFVPWARGPSAYDCWGLVRAVLKEAKGINLPSLLDDTDDETERHYQQCLEHWILTDHRHLQPFDILIFRASNGGGRGHMGIVAKHPFFLHSAFGQDSCVDKFNSPWWFPKIEGAYRYQPQEPRQ